METKDLKHIMQALEEDIERRGEKTLTNKELLKILDEVYSHLEHLEKMEIISDFYSNKSYPWKKR